MGKTHGMSRTRFYKIWCKMRDRCLSPSNIVFKYYGGRGITISKRWMKFENFRDDVYDSYLKHVKKFGEKQTTIDRMNGNGNYEKTNCKWSTWSEQIANRRYLGRIMKKPRNDRYKCTRILDELLEKMKVGDVIQISKKDWKRKHSPSERVQMWAYRNQKTYIVKNEKYKVGELKGWYIRRMT